MPGCQRSLSAWAHPPASRWHRCRTPAWTKRTKKSTVTRDGGMESPSQGSSPAPGRFRVCPGQAAPAQGGSGAGLQRRAPGKGTGEAFPAARGTAGRRHMETQSREWARGAGSSLGSAWGARSCRPRCGPRCRAVPVPSALPRGQPGRHSGGGPAVSRSRPGLAGTAGPAARLEGLERPRERCGGDRAPGQAGKARGQGQGQPGDSPGTARPCPGSRGAPGSGQPRGGGSTARCPPAPSPQETPGEAGAGAPGPGPRRAYLCG